MPRFPHLLAPDAILWQQFLDSYGAQFNYFDYDIRVGEGRDPGNEHPQNIRDMAITLSQRRIDAVGYAPDRIYIFEITQEAGLKALGQLSAYPILYERTFAPDRPLSPIVVCRSFATDAQPAYTRAGIGFYLIPAPTPSLKGD